MRAEIVDHQLPHGGAGLERGAALVRLHDDVGESEQCRSGIRLALEHIERGVSEAPVGQRRDERRLVDHAATRHVDQGPCRAERVDHGGRDEMARFRTALAGDHQEIALPRELDGIGDIGIGRIGLAPRARIDHLHPERRAAIGDAAADVAQTDDAHRLVGDAAAERKRPLARPAAVTHVAIGEHDLSRGREHQADGEIGDLGGQYAGRVGDGNAALARGGEIDAVGADAEQGDHLELWQRHDQGTVGAPVGLGGDPAHARAQLGRQRLGRRLIEVAGDREAPGELVIGRVRE